MISEVRFMYSVLFGQVVIIPASANIALLLLRIYSGYTIMQAGLDKLPLPDWMVDQVVTIGFPFPDFFAWVASFSEFAFGALLCLGLMTRISGLMLAITMGVAAFGFQQVWPLTTMHIAQHFFWIYVLFTSLGAGKYSLDYLVFNPGSEAPSRWAVIALPLFLILLSIGLYREYTPEQPVAENQDKITSIQVAGSFNNWDLLKHEMQNSGNDDFLLTVTLESAGPIQFKFTANKSWAVNWGEENQSSAGFPISGIAERDTNNNTKNISTYIPEPGEYYIKFNSHSFHYQLDSLQGSLP